MNILLDCDGVLLNWEASFREWVMPRVEKPLSLNAQRWDLSAWLGLPKDETFRLIHEFNHSREFEYLTPVRGAVEAVTELAEMGARLRVITSCSRNDAVRFRRRRNLERYFGDVFASVECLDLGESKQASLVWWADGVWVEDNYHGALHGADIGHDTHMLRLPHNREWETEKSDPRITWHDDWVSITNKIKLNLKNNTDSKRVG